MGSGPREVYNRCSTDGRGTLRPTRRKIPSFSLYGEIPAAQGSADSRHNGPLHIEDIQSRSRKYLWRIGTHRHTQLYQCVLVTAGPVTVVLEESQTKFDGAAVAIIPAGTIHSFRFRPETRGYVLTVNLQHLLSGVSAAHQAPIEALFAVPRAADLGLKGSLVTRAAQQLECLLQEYQHSERDREPIRGWLACCVLWSMSQACTTVLPEMQCGQDLERLRQFRELIDEHFTEHWSIERYARRLAVSETSLNRLCRRLTGGTGFDLVQQRLALEARRSLIHGPSSVIGIAGDLGFKDAAYFCRFFRRHNGLSPTEFRRRHAGG
jgi:AraC family transcriptional regulator, transcriptional activator of pobA